MADRTGSTHNPHSRKAMAHRRQRAVGLTSRSAHFLMLRLGPLANEPLATADRLKPVIDQVVNSITGSLRDVAAGVGGWFPSDGWAWVRFLIWARQRRPIRLMPGCKRLNRIGSAAALVSKFDTLINSWFNLADPSTGACGFDL